MLSFLDTYSSVNKGKVRKRELLSIYFNLFIENVLNKHILL